MKEDSCEVHILRVQRAEPTEHPDYLPRCPLCGAKAFLSHDIVDGFDFGYSVGCPRACINDKTHKLGEEEFRKAKLTFFGLYTKEQAINVWRKRCNNKANNRSDT